MLFWKYRCKTSCHKIKSKRRAPLKTLKKRIKRSNSSQTAKLTIFNRRQGPHDDNGLMKLRKDISVEEYNMAQNA